MVLTAIIGGKTVEMDAFIPRITYYNSLKNQKFSRENSKSAGYHRHIMPFEGL